MHRKRIVVTSALIGMVILTLLSNLDSGATQNIKQVRVIAEVASVYIEPSRGSTRIDIVGKGALLNLLQTKKVRGLWYHVSFSSSRYGARVSGFVLDSAVELIDETAPPEEKEKGLPEKAEPPPGITPVKAASPPQAPAQPKEDLILTQLPLARNFMFPRKAAALEELPWRVEEPAPVEMEKTVDRAETKAEPAPLPEKKKSEETEAETAEPSLKPAQPQIISPARPPIRRKAPGRIALGLGYGSSFGGAGACLQFHAGVGIALHAGAGIFPTTLIYSDTDWVKNETLWSLGIKYYLPVKSTHFYPFVDILYGGLRVEAAQVVLGVWDYDYVYSREQKSLWGPSLLTGIELRKGRFGICGALGISYVTTSWDFLQDRASLSFDTSLVVHF